MEKQQTAMTPKENKYLIQTLIGVYRITEEEQKKIDSRFANGVPTAIDFVCENKKVVLFVRHIISIEEL